MKANLRGKFEALPQGYATANNVVPNDFLRCLTCYSIVEEEYAQEHSKWHTVNRIGLG